MKRFVGVCLVCLVLTIPSSSVAQKKEEKKVLPEVKVILPLGAKLGATTKLTIRGIKLDLARDVKFSDPDVKAKIISKGAAPVPDKNPQQVGDTQVVVEAVLPAKVANAPLKLTVITPDGETTPHEILVEPTVPVIAEKEGNDGFRQAQDVEVPVVIEGLIDRPREVDVFRFMGKAKQKVTFEVRAARHGSPLDAILTLYDSTGRQLARHDDLADSVDAELEATLPIDGSYYIVLMDAHDSGSAMHAYRLAGRLR